MLQIKELVRPKTRDISIRSNYGNSYINKKRISGMLGISMNNHKTIDNLNSSLEKQKTQPTSSPSNANNNTISFKKSSTFIDNSNTFMRNKTTVDQYDTLNTKTLLENSNALISTDLQSLSKEHISKSFNSHSLI